MKAIKKSIPRFKDAKAEQAFWQKHDSSEYIDWSKAQNIEIPKLAPSVKNISLRLPESMLVKLKVLANKRDIPYQSLMKVFLAERIKSEFAH